MSLYKGNGGEQPTSQRPAPSGAAGVIIASVLLLTALAVGISWLAAVNSGSAFELFGLVF